MILNFLKIQQLFSSRNVILFGELFTHSGPAIPSTFNCWKSNSRSCLSELDSVVLLCMHTRCSNAVLLDEKGGISCQSWAADHRVMSAVIDLSL